MFIQKLDPEKFAQAFGILCQYVYPWDGVVKPPFGSMWCIVEPGKTASAHNHHEGETFVIMQGNGVLRVDNESVAVTAGDVIYLPPLSMHELRNTAADQTLTFLSVYWEDYTLLNEQITRKSHQEQQTSPKRVLVTATPPTPNGDLHLGHLSGPYLAADIYTRYLRMRGIEVRYISGSDDHQSYVERKGRQIGLSARETADQYGDAIVATLQTAQIVPDLFARPGTSAHHIAFVQDFFLQLYHANKFILKEIDALYCASCDMYLFEAHVRGNCPHCGAASCGNACEECGRPNDCIDLVNPQCLYCASVPGTRRFKRLYFPLSQYHDQLVAYYRSVNMNAHMRVLCDKMLADGLPDIAISHNTDWGIPIPLEEFAGQRMYVWFEMAPGYLAATQEVLHGSPRGSEWQRFWSSDEASVVQFFGFDNGYFHAVLFPALFLAYNPAIRLPTTFVTNEFYRLDGLKFSTSRMHAIWGREFIGPIAADMARFYLAYDRPETEQTNFTREAFAATVQHELIERWQPWLQQLWGKLGREFDGAIPEAGAWSDEQRRFYQCLQQITAEVAQAYEAETFSPQRVTRLLCELVRSTRRFASAEHYLAEIATRRAQRRTAVALEAAAAKTLAQLAAPVMPSFAQRLWADLGYATPLCHWETTLTLPPAGQRIAASDSPYFSL